MNITDRIPPQDLATERSVLGTFIITPSAISDYTEILPNSAFYMTANRKIWETLKYMIENDIPVDLLSLSNELLKKNQLEDCGGSVYLAELSENIVTTFNLPHHIKTLIEKDILRDFITENSANSELCFNENVSIKELLYRRETFQAKTELKCDLIKIDRVKIGKIASFGEFEDEIKRKKEKGPQIIGVSLEKYWPKFSQLFRPTKATLNVITGISGHGKSSFFDSMMIYLSILYGWKWAIYSPENWPIEKHCMKLMQKYAGYSFFDLKETDYINSLEFIKEHFKVIRPDYKNRSFDSVLKLFREAVLSHGVDGILIDPWNKINHILNKFETEKTYISNKLAEFQFFAEENNLFAAIIAHPTKMGKDKDGNYFIPRLYDISGAHEWRDMPDCGFTVYRNFPSGIVDVHVQKIKEEGLMGDLGCTSFTYSRNAGRYTEYDETTFTHETDGTYQETMWQNK